MDWDDHKDHWPMAAHSRFVPWGRAGRWHVQEMGPPDAPQLLLLHGAGGATQSWRGLMPILADHYRCIAVDLPGQGFSVPRAPGRFGLDAMAADVRALCDGEGWNIRHCLAHSAGTAIALRMAETTPFADGQIVGLNAALAKFDGIAGWAFPLAAKALALNPFTARVAAAAASPASVDRLLKGTGSQINADGKRLYLSLISSRSHVDGTLRMMANWSLDGLLARLPRNQQRTHLMVGDNDTTVPPKTSEDAARRMPHATLERLPKLGHLMHEEAPDLIADRVRAALAD